MKIAVITPYYKENAEVILRCIESVKAQSVASDHFLIADGYPQDWISTKEVKHLVLNQSHSDFGNTPRCIGGMLAINQGYDAIAFLDADNWYDSHHIQECIKTSKNFANLDYVVARRRFVRDDGSNLSWPEEPIEFLVDTNCYFLLPGSFHKIPLWGLTPGKLSMFCDRVFLAGLKNDNLAYNSNESVSVNYLCTWAHIYEYLGEDVPNYAKELNVSDFFKWLNNLSKKDHELLERRLGFKLSGELGAHGLRLTAIKTK